MYQVEVALFCRTSVPASQGRTVGCVRMLERERALSVLGGQHWQAVPGDGPGSYHCPTDATGT
jgi:hypothetical protein